MSDIAHATKRPIRELHSQDIIVGTYIFETDVFEFNLSNFDIFISIICTC